MNVERSCVLSAVDNSHDPIQLPDSGRVLIGRGLETKITDRRCSRSQVELIADIDNLEVKLKVIGPNKIGVNGIPLKQNSCTILKHGDRIELLYGKFGNCIEFIPPPYEANEITSGKVKRQLDNTGTGDSKRPCLERDVKSDSNSSLVQENTWEAIGNGKLLIYTTKGVEGRPKIAAYDVDGTIIITKSGRVFPVNDDDWKIPPKISDKLKQFWEDGYKIAFFTNQGGIARGKVIVSQYRKKVEKIVEQLKVPIQVFVSTAISGMYRKPLPGMWNELLKKNDGIQVDLSESLFCGDAAGRDNNWAPKKKKDFSCCDRLFALNIGLPFFTPEEHFQKMPTAPFKLPEFNPSALNCSAPLCTPSSTNITAHEMEVVVMVGVQGSGKSHFATTYLVPKGYAYVNRDSLGTWQRCVAALDTALSTGQSAVIDNTNGDRESRQRYIITASKYNVPCRCFIMKTSIHQAKHNNKFRSLTDPHHSPVSDITINSFMKKYEEPNLKEGFAAIVKINCVPKFSDVKLQELYTMYLLEK